MLLFLATAHICSVLSMWIRQSCRTALGEWMLWAAAGECCNHPQRELSDVPYVEVPLQYGPCLCQDNLWTSARLPSLAAGGRVEILPFPYLKLSIMHVCFQVASITACNYFNTNHAHVLRTLHFPSIAPRSELRCIALQRPSSLSSCNVRKRTVKLMLQATVSEIMMTRIVGNLHDTVAATCHNS